MPFSKWTILIAVFGVLGAVVFFYQFPSYAPQASLDMKLTRPEVIDHARNFLTEMGYDANNLYADANFNFRSGLALYLMESGKSEIFGLDYLVSPVVSATGVK